MPTSWSVSAAGGGKTMDVTTAQPTYQAVATPAGGLDLEAVYVGLGSDADLNTAKDLHGKAVLFYSIDLASRHVGVADNAIRRIEARRCRNPRRTGLPGNLRTQFYPVNSKVPTFSLGQEDGFKLRDLIAASGSTGAIENPARCRHDAKPEIGDDLGFAARHDRRNHLCRRAP
jgi:hypothetical protein